MNQIFLCFLADLTDCFFNEQSSHCSGPFIAIFVPKNLELFIYYRCLIGWIFTIKDNKIPEEIRASDQDVMRNVDQYGMDSADSFNTRYTNQTNSPMMMLWYRSR